MEGELNGSFFLMGIFDNDKVHSVSSTAVLAIADTPNIGADSVLMSVLTDGDMSAEYINAYSNGIGIKMRSMQAWALHNFHYGLPDGTVENGRVWGTMVKNIIEAELGQSITMISTMSGSCDVNAMAREYLTLDRGHDGDDDSVASPYKPSERVGLTTFKSATVTPFGYMIITCTDDNGDFDETVGIRIYTKEAFFHTKYRIGNGLIQYWNYEVSTNIYPELKADAKIEANNPYFPIVPFRVNNVDQAEHGPAGYALNAQQMLNMMGMDFKMVAETISENPDIAEIDQAYLFIGVRLDVESQIATNYLHSHFKNLEKLSTLSKRAYDSWKKSAALNDVVTPPSLNKMTLQDSTFKIDYHYTYIDTVIKTGNVGKIGESIKDIQVKPRAKETYEYEARVGKDGKTETRTRTRFEYEDSRIVLTNQINETQYEETTVHGLYIINHIYASHTINTTLAKAKDILIPVNANVAGAMGIKDADRLYYDSIHLVFNSYKLTKLKWYESGFFKLVVQIIAIVITIYSLGSMAAVAAAAATIGAAAVAVLTQILIKLAIKYMIDYLVQAIGVDAAMVLAIVGSVYGATGTLPFADIIMTAVNVMVAEIQEVFQDEIAGFQAEMDELADTQLELEKEFEALDKELRGEANIDYLDVVRLRPNIDFTESPSAFYHRAIHSGNIGIASLDVAHNYVDSMLELPVPKNFDINI